MLNRIVYKYPLQQVTVLDLPPSSKVVRVGMDAKQPCIWFEIPEGPHTEQRTFHLFMTGELFNGDFDHVGSFAAQQGQFIGHVYEAKRDQGN